MNESALEFLERHLKIVEENKFLKEKCKNLDAIIGSLDVKNPNAVDALLNVQLKNQEQIAKLEAEAKVMCESMNVMTCVWCGHKGKKNTQELLDHVKECSKHPMKKAFDKLAELPKIQKLIDALNEINEMFDGEADIDNNGHSNMAMKIGVIIYEALKEGGK